MNIYDDCVLCIHVETNDSLPSCRVLSPRRSSLASGGDDVVPGLLRVLHEALWLGWVDRLDQQRSVGRLARGSPSSNASTSTRGWCIPKDARCEQVVDHVRDSVHFGGNGFAQIPFQVGKDCFGETAEEGHTCLWCCGVKSASGEYSS